MAKLDVRHGEWVNLEKPGGQVFFVGGGTVAYQGAGRSDTYAGLSPREPLATIQAGLDKTVAGRGDTVVLLPGGVTITAALTMTKADVTLTGYTETGPQTRNPSVITCATNSVEMIAIDAVDVTVENLTLDHNSTTAAVALIDIGDTTISSRAIIRNVFFDMEGSATDTDALNVSTDTVSVQGLVEGCTFHDYDQDGIVIGAANDEWVVRNCRFYDGVTANAGQYAISTVSDGSLIDGCTIRTSGTAGIYANVALLLQIKDCHIAAHGANTIGILAAALATVFTTNSYINVAGAGNVIDYTTSATVPSSSIAWEAVQGTNPTIGVLTTATVDGS
jgi:hypothetical protein